MEYFKMKNMYAPQKSKGQREGRVKTRNRYTFTRQQLIKLFDTIDNPKMMIACFIARMCGLRIEEVSQLKWDGIDFDNRKLEVLNSKWKHRTRDGYGKDRVVRIPQIIVEPLRRWKDLIDGGVWVFPSDKSPDMHITKKAIYNQYHDYLKRAGLLEPHYVYKRFNKKEEQKEDITRYKLNFHSLRAYYITDCRRRGLALEIIAKQAGHEDIQTTAGYSRFNDEEMNRAMDLAFEKPLEQIHVLNPATNPYDELKQDNVSNPREELQRMLIRNQITREEYLEKLSLLEPEGIKKIVEMKTF